MNPTTRSRLSKRVRAGRRGRMRRDFGRRFALSFGLGGYLEKRDEEQKQKALGIFGQAAKKKVNKGVDLPSLDTPERVSKESTPSVSSIVKQLEALLKAANKIGALNGKQQKALVDQITQAKRIAKEQQMESNVPAAIPEGGGGINGDNISPLADIFTDLSKEVEKLLEAVKEKNAEQQEDQGETKGFRGRFLDSMGLGDYRKQRRKEYLRANEYAGWTSNNKLSQLGPAERQALESRGYTFTQNGRVRGPDNRFVSNRNVESTLRQAQRSQLRRPGILGRATDRAGGAIKSGATSIMNLLRSPSAIASGAAGATSTARSSLTSGATRIAGAARSTATGAVSLFSNTARKAAGGAAKVVNLDVIKRAAKPIISKALGKTALKSIPILGTVAGVGFAIDRLLDGDPVGAGLEAASGLAGPVTAIPALVALTSRDVYTSAFGIPPEQDPNVGERMSMVTSAVKGIAEEVLSGTVEPKSPPTSDIAEKASGLQTMRKTQEKVSAATMTGSSTPAPAAAPSNSPSGASGGGAPTTGSSAPAQNAPPAPAVAPAGNAAKEGMSGTPATIPVPDDNPYPNAEDALKQKVEPTVGAAIAEASQLNENLTATTPNINFASGQRVPLPSNMPTTRPGAIGMGNVPDPTYYGVGDILTQLYFGAAA
jgi:hypothetical protein